MLPKDPGAPAPEERSGLPRRGAERGAVLLAQAFSELATVEASRLPHWCDAPAGSQHRQRPLRSARAASLTPRDAQVCSARGWVPCAQPAHGYRKMKLQHPRKSWSSCYLLLGKLYRVCRRQRADPSRS
ncbi:uncharacterized protein LOC134147990 isoform X2 [Rhea pennata]|uniref:uncharacterized protein LOC134147990 isoform X2 n=1 Tax=Rhea pennata TaxID=8795 RepID=UPI002E2598CE